MDPETCDVLITGAENRRADHSGPPQLPLVPA